MFYKMTHGAVKSPLKCVCQEKNGGLDPKNEDL